MAKVKAEFSREFLWDNQQIKLYVLLDVSDDSEGYGVVIGSYADDRTIAFGQGSLSYALADKLYVAIATELESYPANTEISEIEFEHDKLETLHCWEREEILADASYIKELQNIVNYIAKWYKES